MDINEMKKMMKSIEEAVEWTENNINRITLGSCQKIMDDYIESFKLKPIESIDDIEIVEIRYRYEMLRGMEQLRGIKVGYKTGDEYYMGEIDSEQYIGMKRLKEIVFEQHNIYALAQ